MDEDERRKLQRLYAAASSISATGEASSARTNDNREEEMLRLLRNNPLQQQLQDLDRTVATGTSTHARQTDTDSAISLLIRNIQNQRNESELAFQRQNYRDLMVDAGMTPGGASGIDIRSLLSPPGVSYLNQHRLDSFNRHEQPDIFQNISSTRNLPLMSQADLLLSEARTNLARHGVPSSAYLGHPGVNVTETGLDQRLRMGEYLRLQQHDLLAVQQAHQNQQFLDSYGGQSRLAFLLQQRQQLLDHQSATASLPQSRNIPLTNDEPTEKVETDETKIRSVEALIEKPKRPLSAYNIFFRQERQKLLGETDGDDNDGDDDDAKGSDDFEDKKPAAVGDAAGSKKRKRGKPHHKVSFEQMAKIIGQRWKELESDDSKKKHYQEIAQKDKERYQAEIAVWKQQRNALSSKIRKKNEKP